MKDQSAIRQILRGFKDKRALIIAAVTVPITLLINIILNPPLFDVERAIEGGGFIEPKPPKSENLREKSEAERVEAERIEAERLADWKANFPYKPIYHPTLRFDPSIYKPYSRNSKEGKSMLFEAVNQHGFLKAFFENPLIYSRQFEQIHSILQEYGIEGHPYILGHLFQNLRDYHEARQWAPDLLWHRWGNEEWNPKLHGWEYKMVPMDGETTWGDRAEDAMHGIHTALDVDWIAPLNQIASSLDEIKEIANRLMTEIDGWENVEGTIYSGSPKHEEELQAGDEMLIPYEGWLEDYRAFQKKEWGWEPPPGHP